MYNPVQFHALEGELLYNLVQFHALEGENMFDSSLDFTKSLKSVIFICKTWFENFDYYFCCHTPQGNACMCKVPQQSGSPVTGKLNWPLTFISLFKDAGDSESAYCLQLLCVNKLFFFMEQLLAFRYHIIKVNIFTLFVGKWLKKSVSICITSIIWAW